MDGTRELVDLALVGTALAVLSGVSLVAATGLMIWARVKKSVTMARTALLVAGGILLYPLWMVYNGIEDYFGLDSVTALVINLALFGAVGIAGGLALRGFGSPRRHGDTETGQREENAAG